MKPKYRGSIEKSERIDELVEQLYADMPEIESARAVLLTKSYMETEGEPIITRRAKAFYHILENIPIIIREHELIVGSSTLAERGCQTFPEFSYEWLEKEFDTIKDRSADPFYIDEKTKRELLEVHKYWKGKTTSELALSFMAPEALRVMEHNVFTPGNYFYNGVGHVTVQYEKVISIGFEGIIKEAEEELNRCRLGDADYAKRSHFLRAVILSCQAVILYAKRYAELADAMANDTNVSQSMSNGMLESVRKKELKAIAAICRKVPAKGAGSFYEACQSFWFVQQLLQVESSGHSISPGRFDQYMYPYYKADIDSGKITKESAQELIDCIWVKLNDLNKCRDADSAEGFAGYSLFQNLIVGGQTKDGLDATNELSYMCIEASGHVYLPQPSLSIRVWNGTPHELLIKAAELTRTGIGFPAYYNDEVVIPSLLNRGLSLEDARDYNIIGCVEPQKAGKTEGWHDAAFFNMLKPLEFVFSNGMDLGEQVSIPTGSLDDMEDFSAFYDSYKRQMDYNIELLVNADNAIDAAHSNRCPLPFLSSMVDDCIKRGMTTGEGGAVYNFTGPQGFGIANVADSLYAIKKLVYDEKRISLAEYKKVMALNYGKGYDAVTIARFTAEAIKELEKVGRPVSKDEVSSIVWSILSSKLSDDDKMMCQKLFEMIEELPKYGNDISEVDNMAREAAYLYTRPLEMYKNPRGGIFQAGLYPVSANVPLGAQTGATPDGRLSGTPIADGVSPSAGKDKYGPTAAANSVSRLDHGIASNGTLFNQKFHPSALSGDAGLDNFIALIRTYFDQKGSHVQFNVVDRETLLDAQKNPDNYKHLVVRVAGYSALFTTLSKSLQDDIIGRTEQGF